MPDRVDHPRQGSAIEQLVAALDRQNTLPMDSLAYKFDIVQRGAARPCSRTGWRELMVQKLGF